MRATTVVVGDVEAIEVKRIVVPCVRAQGARGACTSFASHRASRPRSTSATESTTTVRTAPRRGHERRANFTAQKEVVCSDHDVVRRYACSMFSLTKNFVEMAARSRAPRTSRAPSAAALGDGDAVGLGLGEHRDQHVLRHRGLVAEVPGAA